MKRLILTGIIKYPEKTVRRAKEGVPFEPGMYDFGYEYPFTKNVWKSVYDGYYFGRLTINEDHSIDYLDEHFIMPEEGVITLERRFVGQTIIVEIKLDEKP